VRPSSFTLKSNGGLLRVLQTKVHISEAFDPANVPGVMPKMQEFVAIWDTGATATVITQKVVDACGLKPTGVTLVQTANGQRSCNVYFVNIGLPNQVGFQMVRVTCGDILGTDVLIGMDIITTGDFVLTHKNGTTVFSFRVPSLDCIDYVEQWKAAKVANNISNGPPPARNRPCPCGSGKKYKHCHGAGTPPVLRANHASFIPVTQLPS